MSDHNDDQLFISLDQALSHLSEYLAKFLEKELPPIFGDTWWEKGNVLNCVQKVLEIEKGHGKKVCVDQNTDLHPLGGNHDPWQEV